MAPTRNHLLSSAQALCNDFAAKKSTETILSHFTSTHQCTAIEHGEPCLAPFLGRPFVGRSEVGKYFDTIAQLLSFDNMTFSEYIVDTEASRVACKGRAKFTWIKTGESWDETFAYILDFDDEGKVTDYQVWADSGAAYLARAGNLAEARKATA